MARLRTATRRMLDVAKNPPYPRANQGGTARDTEYRRDTAAYYRTMRRTNYRVAVPQIGAPTSGQWTPKVGPNGKPRSKQAARAAYYRDVNARRIARGATKSMLITGGVSG